MKKMIYIFLMLSPILVACDNSVDILDVDRFPNHLFKYVNDTEYDCLIYWCDFGSDSMNEQQIAIPRGSTYTQVFPQNEGLSLDNHSRILNAKEVKVLFYVYDEEIDIYSVYNLSRDEVSRKVVVGKEWSSLPNYKQETIDVPYNYSNVVSVQLSDVLNIQR